jgi:2-keto-4-pentenoate hydratase/2-oxohepta-3-ene-1,7-dioic acid hydratase in catechol pathway
MTTIYCIGRNYAEHAKELKNPVPTGEPVVFLKAESAIRGLDAGIVAFNNESFHHEVEVVIRIGQTVAMGQSSGWDVVDAITLGIDVTRRQKQSDLKAAGLPWVLAKSFSGSAVLAPWLLKRDLNFNLETSAVEFFLKINGELRQRGSTSDMIFSVPTLVTWLATFNELRPGDLIYTGTPAGVAELRVGDHFELGFESPVARQWSGTY